jgi:membrane-bound metal-dependent hydrolase YbcI (DUF457 family)
MYVGHAGVALGAKRAAPSIALGTLIFATYLPDWIDAGLCITGRYHNAQMLSHSLPAVLLLALLAAATQIRQPGWPPALIVGAVVISHILLDYLTGIKPTWPGGPFIGLEIYRHPILDFAVESLVIVAGWLLYRKTLPRHRSNWNPANVMLFLLLAMQGGIDAARLLLPSVNKC